MDEQVLVLRATVGDAPSVDGVARVVADAGVVDPVGWLARQVCAAFAWVGCTVTAWAADEWAVDVDPPVWVADDAPRIPCDRVRAVGAGAVHTYQDDDVSGLCFLEEWESRELPEGGELRHRTGLPWPTGRVREVAVALVFVAPGHAVLGEVVVDVDGHRMRLMAAEAEGPDRWLLLDESVVVLPDAADADRLDWIGPRPCLLHSCSCQSVDRWAHPKGQPGQGIVSGRK